VKKYTYKFRSIMVNHVEKVIPGTIFSKMVMEMDDSAVEEHTLILTYKEIINDTAWITNFVLSLMLVAAATGVIFTGVYVAFGRSVEQQSWNIIKFLIITSGILIFIILWIFLSVKVSIENKKRKHVEHERGKGNWRIVDESKWENFHRLLMISKNRRESEKLIK